MLATQSFLKSNPPILETDIEYLVVAAGGGGGAYHGGGGGGGGFRTSAHEPSGVITLTSGTPYTIDIGTPGGTHTDYGNGYLPGGESIFSTITSAGGGMGRSSVGGTSGGSGGGASRGGPSGFSGGAGDTPNTTPDQGYKGGDSVSLYAGAGGGGGGGAAPNITSNSDGGNGGIPGTSSITGTSLKYAGGGGGSAHHLGPAGIGLGGGSSEAEGHADKGGATDGNQYDVVATPGYANTGGGAGSGAYTTSPQTVPFGAPGGSGVVIIAYPVTRPALATIDDSHVCNGQAGVSGPIVENTDRSGYRVYKFTAGCGNITLG